MWTRLLAYVRGILGRRRASAEADEELAFHLERATAAHRRRGLTAAAARQNIAVSKLTWTLSPARWVRRWAVRREAILRAERKSSSCDWVNMRIST